jgi:3',5'-nucleoside bisphosphate phosphatase
LNTFRAELHVHTVLSPCAGVEMIPPLIVQTALEKGLRLIAITDHNATANIRVVMEAARGSDLTVLAGMELQTREEVHLLCLFDSVEQAVEWQKTVDLHLPERQNKPDFFGEQFVVDATGDFIRSEERLLSTSANIGLEEAAEQVKVLGGLPIPAHIDRQAFGLIANLGLIPPGFEVLEISRHITPAAARQKYPQIGSTPLIQSGDVHFLEDFLGGVEFEIETPTIAELHLAFQGQRGRKAALRS